MYLHKRKSFEHEREVRAIFQGSDGPRFFDGEPLGECGLDISVDTDRLIENVYLAPTTPQWQADVIQAVLDRFNVKRRVRHSSLAADPVF